MRTEKVLQDYLYRGFFTLLALVVPVLVAYNIQYQRNTPVIDISIDWETGIVMDVPERSLGDYAGFMVGDVFRTVDGVPVAEWFPPSAENVMVELERDGEPLVLELYVAPLAKVNLLPLISASLVGLVFWSISLILLIRRFRESQVRLLFVLAQAIAVTLLFPLAYPPTLRAPYWLLSLSVTGFYMVAPLLLHFYITFPVVLGAPRQRRWGLGALYVLAFVGLSGWFLDSPVLWGAGVICSILTILAAVVIMIYVYLRRATSDERRRLRLVVFGTVLSTAPSILFYLLPGILGASFQMPTWLTSVFLIFAPLSYLYATTRHNLFGIDRLLNRALVYAILSLGILLLYLGPFLLLYRLLPDDLLLQMMVVAGLTLLVGLSFEWSRTQVQRLVDRLFYGGWYDYPGVVEAISAGLSQSLQREQVDEVLTHQVPKLMQLQNGQLWIGSVDETPPVKENPSLLQYSFNLQGRHRGIWAVGPRRDGEDFSEVDQRILTTLARQAEIALNNVLLVETLRRQLSEIREVQRQLLRSREEERARLARDLHDGPIQSLVSLNLQLGLLVTPSDPSQAVEEDSPLIASFKEMRAEVKSLLADLRQVCAELRPPMLDTLGLGAAIRALAGDWSNQHGVPVQLELPPNASLRSLPEEVSVNLYRVVQEALTNVARHAGAGQVAISLTWETGCLVLSVRDDGHGFIPPIAPNDLTTEGHFGLAGMQERVSLIGGRWSLKSAPGEGTIVNVLWPSQA